MSFSLFYCWYCLGVCLVSCISNGFLIFVAHKQQDGVGIYRFFTQATILIGILYSISFAVAQPFWYAGPGMLGFFSIAPWSEHVMLIRIFFQFWFTSFVLIILSMSASFLFRYGLLSSSLVVSWFKTPCRLAIIALFVLLILALWLYVTNFLLFGDSQAVRWKMHSLFWSEYNVDLLDSYALTVDINDPVSAQRSVIATGIISAAFQVLIGIMVYCGWNIHNTVKIRTISVKRTHGRALNMMIAQALNAVLFMYTPACVNLLGIFVDSDFGDLPKFLAMCLALFPIFNPIIVIYFTEEYKRFILRQRSSIVQVYGSKDQPSAVVP